MRRFLNWLSRKRFPYEPLISISISRGRLIHNLREFRRLMPRGWVAPVLKSNAYGHGLLETASILKNEPAVPFFVVDSYFEAVALRAKGIKTPLLVVGYTRPGTIAKSNLKKVAFTVTTIDTLKSIKDISSPVRIHLKIDTGMRRQGILEEELPFAIEIIKSNRLIFLEGVCTHFCDADNDDESFTESQIDHWNRAVRELKAAFNGIWYFHAAATDGSLFSEDIQSNVLRIGIGLYGISPNEKLRRRLDLKPVLSMSTIVTGMKMLMRGETIGYGKTFRADRDLCIATLPIGYYEGLDRGLSNSGFVEVGENRVACPIIGRVSMNISSIDASAVPGTCALKMGMPVTVISNDPESPCSLRSHAKNSGAFEYELAVHIPSHLKRVVID